MEKSVKRPASCAREDLISKLPDALISQILLHLPTKEAVKTSVLSNRWKSVWLLIPGLHLNTNEFPSYNVFVDFMEKFLDFSKGENLCLHKLKLSIGHKIKLISIDKDDENGIKSWITRWMDFVVTHKVKHLDVCLLVKRKCLEVIPLSLYTSQTLINLRLRRVKLGSFESVSLPCLKTMHLERNVYGDETRLASLISSCPVLEDLSIVSTVNDNVEVLRVFSQSLTSLSLAFDTGKRLRVFGRLNPGVLIDAPRLKYLKFKNETWRSKIVSNLVSLAKVDILGGFRIARASDGVGLSTKQMARNFFTGISRVRHMILSHRAMRLIWTYLKEEPSTLFYNLSCLEAQPIYSTGKSLSTFLERCPNLKFIVLNLTRSIMPGYSISFLPVPQCLLSSLEFVEIKSVCNIWPLEIRVARYFVRNSVVLKKLVMHLSLPMDKQSTVDFENLLALPRRSSMCEIVNVCD